MQYINTTPHRITFLMPSGLTFEVDPCGILINATLIEQDIMEYEDVVPSWTSGRIWGYRREGLTLVTPTFVASLSEEEKLAKLERDYPDAIIIGSIIAAQAFPGRVLAMTPAPGYERVPVNEKRMSPTKFLVYLAK